MTPQGKSSSLERLHDVEQRIVRVVELSGAVMEELGNSQGPRAEAVAAHCREFMLYMKEIQTTMREEIKSACEYRPFEKCDYSARIANEICCKKLELSTELQLGSVCGRYSLMQILGSFWILDAIARRRLHGLSSADLDGELIID
uniref:Mediator of RNA polymerase II transcription subunit 11 n=1 Tax=Aegilops tauschii TaxID=37682 RepID=M8AXE2_AEGTA